ncbi:hypothetical protein JX265_009528 [Neoarthrinium moseri]|uniref:Protein kinase domain-containing protein n=1 Tax=Neoarthrinium moseri TaxID=1658444 RepID=A0A9P9WG52_9PEZI|nr:hypothetical protein JX265_009528 [Neoarthrinium moseri]
MSAELVLAVIAGADICLQYGKKLIRAYKDLKSANDIVTAKILIVDAFWSRTVLQVEFVKRVASTMGPEHCGIHIEVFEMLRSKLAIATARVDSLITDGGEVKKWRMPFVRSLLDDTIEQLEMWQRIFDPTWYLILRIGDKLIDSALSSEYETMNSINGTLEMQAVPSKTSTHTRVLSVARGLRKVMNPATKAKAHISLPDGGLDWEDAQSVLYSETRIIKRANSAKRYAVDTIDCRSGIDVTQLRADSESLARKLQQVDPETFGLLASYGIVKRKLPTKNQIASLNMIFSLPAESRTVRSLRQSLMRPQECSLSRVLRLARQLTEAISFIHTCEFVHKNIRPETILSFMDEESHNRAFGSTYLLGFDSFRNVNFHTMRGGDTAWERNLYRHPFRQGLLAHDKYTMQHDVYSLGVCLLEIGLWTSFIEYESNHSNIVEDITGPIPSNTLGLQVEDFKPRKAELLGPYNHIKDHLVELAKSRLPMRMGDKYTSVVITCLTCLDEGNEDFGDDCGMQDEDGVLVGVRFIEKVLLRLDGISF